MWKKIRHSWSSRSPHDLWILQLLIARMRLLKSVLYAALSTVLRINKYQAAVSIWIRCLTKATIDAMNSPLSYLCLTSYTEKTFYIATVPLLHQHGVCAEKGEEWTAYKGNGWEHLNNVFMYLVLLAQSENAWLFFKPYLSEKIIKWP